MNSKKGAKIPNQFMVRVASGWRKTELHLMSTLSVHSAAQKDQLSLIRSLINEDPKLVNAVDVDERTPLHWAASSGSLDITRYLIDQKADIDKPDGSGWTALHIASSAGHEEIVRELVGAGADVNRKNDKGLTPL